MNKKKLSAHCRTKAMSYILIETKAHTRQVIRDFVKNLNQSNASKGSNGTGWRRIAFMNMTDSSDICPLNLTMYTSPVRSCGH